MKPRILNEMETAVDKDRQGELVLALRLRMWAAMESEFGEESLFRRNVLAFVVARDLAPLWHGLSFEQDCSEDITSACLTLVPRSMENCRRYLRGDMSWKEAEEPLVRMLELSDHITNCLVDRSLQCV